MSVGGIDPNAGSADAALQAKMQQARAAFGKLAQSLKAGDLSGAQDAFATLQANVPQGGANPVQNQLDALGKALQSGNLVAAQQAFAPLQGAAQAHSGQGGRGPAPAGGGGGGSTSSAKKIVSETSTTSSNGEITTNITYSDGSKETTTSYGPPPNSTQSVFA